MQQTKADNNPSDFRDPEVFALLWHKTQPHLLAMAYQILGSEFASEDVASDSYVKLWRGLHHQQLVFETELAAIKWLRVTTRNGCLKLLKQQHNKEISLHTTELEFVHAADDWTIEDLKAEQLQRLYAEVRQLPPRARQIFEMKHMQGRSNDAIAKELGLTYQTVSDHLARAMKMLRTALKDRPELLLILPAICSTDILARG